MCTGCSGVIGILLVEVFPPSQDDSLFSENLSNKDYDNILLLGDFSVTTENTNL